MFENHSQQRDTRRARWLHTDSHKSDQTRFWQPRQLDCIGRHGIELTVKELTFLIACPRDLFVVSNYPAWFFLRISFHWYQIWSGHSFQQYSDARVGHQWRVKFSVWDQSADWNWCQFHLFVSLVACDAMFSACELVPLQIYFFRVRIFRLEWF